MKAIYRHKGHQKDLAKYDGMVCEVQQWFDVDWKITFDHKKYFHVQKDAVEVLPDQTVEVGQREQLKLL